MVSLPQTTTTECSCSLWSTDPQLLESQGVPPGFCGHCDVCGAPGHLRHFPGALPVTGTWCDPHFKRTLWLHPMAVHGRWVWGMGLAVILIAAVLFPL